MTAPGSPWADPATTTEPVAYLGPPPTAPYAPPAPGPYGGGWPVPAPYWPAYGPPVPARPRRPGQLVASSVLAFVQGGLVALTSAYLLLLASTLGVVSTGFGGDAEADALVAEGTVVTIVQLLSVVALVVGGILVLNRRSRSSWLTLLVALAVQLLLAVYWLVRLSSLDALTDDVLGSAGLLVAAVLFYVAAPAVALGLLLVGPVRRWSDDAGAAPVGGAAR
ncbi:hypothetical protein JD79_03835 [Geodermatophilus normandii]|uniref:Uncharacterized protein n=1 Tax=Geodermatophilus normandii TaxID=1137989 RepID=A0A317QPK0_9ACTN|nr:hypothetical protein [Geodermatophilus normandii]PWW24646.1 hypothetical protein JD79_03835 [Geodermatophilus normandii]